MAAILPLQSQLIIDNEPRSATGGATFDRTHSQDGRVITTGAAGTVEDAVAAVESASTAFPEWAKTGPSERRAVLLKAADLLEERAGEFISTMAAEVSASQDWAGFNVFLTTQCLREAARLASQLVGETIPNDRGVLSMTVRQPAGVVLSMAPWNAPGVLGMRSIAYPLVCGNTVVFRGSEGSPRSHQMLVDVLIEAGHVNINGATVQNDANAPFGGMKNSGYGGFRRPVRHRRVHRGEVDHHRGPEAAVRA